MSLQVTLTRTIHGEIMKILDEINKRGTTVLVVTHNMEIVQADEEENYYHE